MKITEGQLRALIRDEIRRASINEAGILDTIKGVFSGKSDPAKVTAAVEKILSDNGIKSDGTPTIPELKFTSVTSDGRYGEKGVPKFLMKKTEEKGEKDEPFVLYELKPYPAFHGHAPAIQIGVSKKSGKVIFSMMPNFPKGDWSEGKLEDLSKEKINSLVQKFVKSLSELSLGLDRKVYKKDPEKEAALKANREKGRKVIDSVKKEYDRLPDSQKKEMQKDQARTRGAEYVRGKAKDASWFGEPWAAEAERQLKLAGINPSDVADMY